MSASSDLTRYTVISRWKQYARRLKRRTQVQRSVQEVVEREVADQQAAKLVKVTPLITPASHPQMFRRSNDPLGGLALVTVANRFRHPLNLDL